MSKLAWFPFYVDDFTGGTTSMLQAELGAYLQALLAQWRSGDLQAILDEPERLTAICRGPFSASVREKFKTIKVKGVNYLQNEKLKAIYDKQKITHENRVRKARNAVQARLQNKPQDELQDDPGDNRTQIPDISLGVPKEIIPSDEHGATNGRQRDLLFEAVAEVCRVDWNLCTNKQRGELNQTVGILREQGHTPAEVQVFARWWAAVDWRGKKGQAPTPSQVRENWQNAFVTATTKRKAVIPG